MEADRSVETPWAIATPVAAAYENARALTAEAVGDDLRDEMSAIFPTALSGKEESGALPVPPVASWRKHRLSWRSSRAGLTA